MQMHMGYTIVDVDVLGEYVRYEAMLLRANGRPHKEGMSVLGVDRDIFSSKCYRIDAKIFDKTLTAEASSSLELHYVLY